MARQSSCSRRRFLKGAASVAAAPLVIPGTALGLNGATPANDRIVFAGIGMGGQGRGDLGGFLGFPQVQCVAVCDVVKEHRDQAKRMVDNRYQSQDCQVYNDFREITHRDDIDAVLIATPDHWHAIISVDAMIHGKDVYCEKPETLTVREGRRMVEIARRYGRVFSGGSQRVWGDYHWFHKMVQGGRIGEVHEAWANIWGSSGPCNLEPHPVPDGVDWEMWLGPTPHRPFHPTLIRGGFRPYRDYSGGGMTDWGCHTFAGILFALNLHKTGPTTIIPPDGQDYPQLTYIFDTGQKVYHGGGWDGIINFRGTEGELSEGEMRRRAAEAPDIYIPNYKGEGGIFGDFLHCVKTRERPFRDIEIAHRAASMCHLGNIAYWTNQTIHWNPETEQIIDNPIAERWLDRPKREPWNVA